jgi:hypothetical protein
VTSVVRPRLHGNETPAAIFYQQVLAHDAVSLTHPHFYFAKYFGNAKT